MNLLVSDNPWLVPSPDGIGDWGGARPKTGLQHELYIIVPFLLLFPSVLLLPDVIHFSNLDAQTHQEPQKIHTHTKHWNLNPNTHTQMGCSANWLIFDANDFSTCCSNIRRSNSEASNPSHGIHIPLHISDETLRLTAACLFYRTAGMKLYLPARSMQMKKPWHYSTSLFHQKIINLKTCILQVE